jgi:hypothetical protein
MIKLFFWAMFSFLCVFSLKAAETAGSDQEFIQQLDSTKNPFEDGMPKPVVEAPKPVYHPPEVIVPKPRPIPIAIPLPEPVTLPGLHLKGVIVGDGINEAIINDQDVPLGGSIEGVRVISLTREGVELLFKGKKFFLKVE